MYEKFQHVPTYTVILYLFSFFSLQRKLIYIAFEM